MEKETARIEAFSDGVFAIAITLLILEIKVPPAGTADLATQLIKQWPSYVSFVISFAFIGIMWINHHRLFTQIRRSDNTLMLLNLLLLLGVCVVPYPTAVLAQHLSGPDQRPAAVLYHGTYFAIAIFFNLLWGYARKRGMVEKTSESALRISVQYGVGPFSYLVCLLLVWISIPASLLLNVVLAVFYALPPQHATTVVKGKAKAFES